MCVTGLIVTKALNPRVPQAMEYSAWCCGWNKDSSLSTHLEQVMWIHIHAGSESKHIPGLFNRCGIDEREQECIIVLCAYSTLWSCSFAARGCKLTQQTIHRVYTSTWQWSKCYAIVILLLLSSVLWMCGTETYTNTTGSIEFIYSRL